jgi:hypothetical protein
VSSVRNSSGKAWTTPVRPGLRAAAQPTTPQRSEAGTRGWQVGGDVVVSQRQGSTQVLSWYCGPKTEQQGCPRCPQGSQRLSLSPSPGRQVVPLAEHHCAVGSISLQQG